MSEAATQAPGWPPPDPGAAPLPRMILAQTGLETRLLVRNGEQLLLTLIIPLLLLVGLSLGSFIKTPGNRHVNFLLPGIIALAVISTAFTSQAITTGFERRYGVLKRLGATPLPRGGLIAAKTLMVVGIEVAQTLIIVLAGLALGWHPRASAAAPAWVVVLLLAGTAAFSGLALLMAGTLRAEATLAAANLVYLIMLGIGGIIFPLTRFGPGAQAVLRLLPPGALSDGLRSVLFSQGGLPVQDLVVLAVWAAAGIALAARTFRWE